MMQFAGGAALTNVNDVRCWVDLIERLAQPITVALRAVQENMHMRVSARHIRVPDVDFVEGQTSVPMQPLAEMLAKAV